VSAAEQDPVERAAWREEVALLAHEMFVFVDETHSTITMTRRYARAPRHERAVGQVPRNHGTPTTLLAALGIEGLRAEMTLPGAVNREAFAVYVREVLVPVLLPGQVVILDNLSAHKGAAVRALIEAAGCRLLFLPPYSPDFAPIEQAFAKIKEALRAAGARTQEALDAAISVAIQTVMASDAAGWFTHCGYSACST
jgi:transposase